MTSTTPPLDHATAAARAKRLAMPGAEDFRALVSLAIPVVVVQVGLMFMGVVDTILVGHVSATNLAAVALGNLYTFGVCAFGMGSLMALDPVVAQAVGAQDQPAVARAIQRGIILSLAITVPTVLVYLPAGQVFRVLGQPAEVVPIAARFVHYSIPGILAFFGFVVLRQSLQAMGRMRPIVIVILLANVINAVLCWLLVFGHVGSVSGAAGAAIASVVGRWSLVVGLLVLAWRDLEGVLVPFRRESFAPRPLLRMIGIGAPIGTQYLLEFGVFGIVALLMGHLGTVQVAAHQIAINIASLAFMVPLGVSGAASVLVGRAVGAGQPDAARRAAFAALCVGFAFMTLSGAILGLWPRPLAEVYSNDRAVLALAATLIPLAAVFQVFDGLQIVSIGVLRGVGDTRTPMIVNVLGFWLIGFPVSLWLGFKAGYGAVGLWWGLVVGLAAVAVFLVMRVRSRLAASLARLVIEEEGAA